MTTIAIAANVSGTADTEDRQAIILAITQENERRTFAGIALLPFSTAAERKTSYETISAAYLTDFHKGNIALAVAATNADTQFSSLKPLWLEATPQKKAAAVAALQ